MVKDVEGSFKVGEQSLYTRSWLPDDGNSTRAKLILIHGFSDHVGMYADFAAAMAAAGIAVHGFDQRGWGKSVTKPAEKGRTGPTAMVLADIAAFMAPHLSSASEIPVFVMGHSMGGASALTLASDPAHEEAVVSRVRGWMLESPFLGWPEGEQPSWLKVTLGRLVGRMLPNMHLVHRIPPEKLTRDPAWVKIMAEDKLSHDTGTLAGLAGALDRTGALASGEMKLLPCVGSLWLGHGTADLTTSYEASKKWFENHAAKAAGLKDRRFQTYEGWYHVLHVEPGKEEYYRHVAEWILERCPSTTAAAAASVETESARTTEHKPGSKL